MAGVLEAQASVMRRRRSCNISGRVEYTCPFMCPHKKKSNGVKSGMLGGLLSYSSQSCTTCNVSQHLLAAIPAQVWIGMDEHLIHSGFSQNCRIFDDALLMLVTP
ncbi:hypothetical protein AVEN_197428-1 [Araneus ventricosus]|uniref:Uncharacterized protein n=1 Tax=Araneus ventricosus TaxID=182803 RepID=A0A4Y2IBG6_ARAVE|nr:hypothetical protein AVEN_197428-1 [Araneus ventricosus]